MTASLLALALSLSKCMMQYSTICGVNSLGVSVSRYPNIKVPLPYKHYSLNVIVLTQLANGVLMCLGLSLGHIYYNEFILHTSL